VSHWHWLRYIFLKTPGGVMIYQLRDTLK
jgi:hypothetical protein